MNTNSKYLADILNDELWAEMEPAEQLALCAETRTSAQQNLTRINDWLHDKTIRSTGHERQEAHQRRASTIRFIDTLDVRTQRAKIAQTEKNIRDANSEANKLYNKLRRAVEAHRDTTTSTDDPNVIAEADDALYAELDEVMKTDA